MPLLVIAIGCFALHIVIIGRSVSPGGIARNATPISRMQSHQERPMWMKITLAAALCAASVNFANAQSVDQNPANRGYPAYAQPNGSGYYMGMPQGNAGPAAHAPDRLRRHSRPAALQQRHWSRAK